MDFILDLDRQFFLLINGMSHVWLTDQFAIFFSWIGTAGAIWFVLGLWMCLGFKKKDYTCLWQMGLIGGIIWFLVDVALKPLISRPRPSELLTDFSFPSGHATISWALAYLLAIKVKRFRWLLYTLAFLISFSRIYLGVHYPLDVLGGGFLGLLIARIVIKYLHAKVKCQAITDE